MLILIIINHILPSFIHLYCIFSISVGSIKPEKKKIAEKKMHLARAHAFLT